MDQEDGGASFPKDQRPVDWDHWDEALLLSLRRIAHCAGDIPDFTPEGRLARGLLKLMQDTGNVQGLKVPRFDQPGEKCIDDLGGGLPVSSAKVLKEL